MVCCLWAGWIGGNNRESGTALCAPTVEAGFAPACKDKCASVLRLQLWERKYNDSKGKVQYSLA